MPQRPSAVKSVQKSQERHVRNKSVKSRLRTETVKFERAVERGDSEEASRQNELLTQLLQKAVSKGVIHKNTAARKQSKLQSKLAALTETES